MTLLLIIALQLADAALTLRILSAGGWEANPLLTHLFPLLGVVGTLALAKAGGIAFAAWLWRHHRARALRWLTEISGAVVAWNLLAVLA